MRLNRILSLCLIVLTGLSVSYAAIVPQNIADIEDMAMAANFLNNYHALLNATPSQAVSDAIKRLKQEGLSYSKGSDKTLKTLNGTEDFNLSFIDGKYVASWSVDGKKIAECSFPANIALLKMKDKIGLENLMIENLRNSIRDGATINSPSPLLEDLEPITQSDFYILDRGYYFTPRLKNRLVFTKSEVSDGYGQLLMDTDRYRLESLANMMISGYAPNDHKVKVKVDKYGYESEIIEVPFSSLYNLMAGEGSTPYWGTESFDGKTVKGLYVWVNNPGGFVHSMSVSVPIDAVSNSTEWDVTLHCYLRFDNIKSMFEEFPSL